MLRARYRRIIFFFARIIISIIIWDLFLPRLGLRRLSQSTRSRRLQRIAIQYRALAVQMGGVLIKVGQFLSARVDVLPSVITSELTGLQDEVPEEDFGDIRALVEDEFGAPIEEKFLEFDDAPEAAASLGQVHRARVSVEATDFAGLRGAEEDSDNHILEVVVKVQRPDIETIIATDLAALKTVGNWLKRYPPINRRADVPALLAEFSRILYEEIDYIKEGQNAETFAEHFRNRTGVHVPDVVWSHTTKRVLTLEDVRAIKITDYDRITAAGIDRAEVAVRLFETYLQQIFEDGFFHADPHPGNLFVTPQAQPLQPQAGEEGERDKADTEWLLTFVDFGMVGRLSPEMLSGMREMVIAVGTRNASRLVKSYQQLGVLLPGADIELIERAEARLFDRFWGKSMQELASIGQKEMLEFAREFRELIFTMPFQIPQDMILLGRAVGILSGMCTGLNPEFNVWEGLAPYAQKLVFEESGGRRFPWLEEIGELLRNLLEYPRRVVGVLEKLERGDLAVRVPELTDQVKDLEHAVNRMAGGFVFAALLLAGVEVYLAGEIQFAIILLAAAALTLTWILFHR
jgi:predicted unusual protein kinase regulating ubiquinone biosynthesis (AarF/ABC1/UbiB family)